MKTPKYISEIFSMVREKATDEEKISILRQYNSNALRQICRYAYDPSFSSLVTKIPKYRVDDSPYGYSYSDLIKEYNRVLYFLEYPKKPIKLVLKEQKMYNVLKNIMERMHWADSAILEAILLRKEIPNISKEIIEKAFPNIFKEISPTEVINEK
jgi:hypothetical protein